MPAPHSPWARLKSLDSLALSISLALHCSPTSLEQLPVAQLRAMAADIAKRLKP